MPNAGYLSTGPHVTVSRLLAGVYQARHTSLALCFGQLHSQTTGHYDVSFRALGAAHPVATILPVATLAQAFGSSVPDREGQLLLTPELGPHGFRNNRLQSDHSVTRTVLAPKC